MRQDFPTRHIIPLITFTSLILANPFFADDYYAQAPFEVAAAGPTVDPNPVNFDLLSDTTFATDSGAFDTLPANDKVIVAGGAQQQNLPQKEKNDDLPPTWMREGGPGRGTPKPSNPKIPEGGWGRYPGYPNEHTNLDDLYELDPNTRKRLQFKQQPKWHCDEGFHLLCCRPLLILCYPCKLSQSLHPPLQMPPQAVIVIVGLGSQRQGLTFFRSAFF